ncbi:hypothetical protein KKF34_19490 [Myxococcota bacterium]|nr:hypothetical protein [Myxococcota bacterium]MBU1383104.1 hypothetical protein [Myxococcota bacterium]MBU1499073.1 hypothetical protein [Myxococcota bacterium]
MKHLFFLLAILLIATGCDDDNSNNNSNNTNNTNTNNTNNTNNLPLDPAISVASQTLESLSTRITVTGATSNGNGWIAIREASETHDGTILGYISVADGENQFLNVDLMRPVMDSEILEAHLLSDAGSAGTFEPDGDDVAQTLNSEPVIEEFTVTVPATTPAVRIFVENVGMAAFTVSSVEPVFFETLVGTEENNETLTLYAGWRYEIVNSAPVAHPYELVTMGTTAAEDTVLLSQEDPGGLEENEDILWMEDEVTGALQFTIAPSLESVLTGYRCGVHTASMRGQIIIQ